MEFTPINTQEEFDARVTEIYGDVKDLQGQISTLTGERDTLQGKVKGYETEELKRKIAMEKKIPLDMALRLYGDDEKSIRADADTLAGALRAYKGPAPMAEPNQPTESTTRARLRRMLGNMKGE